MYPDYFTYPDTLTNEMTGDVQLIEEEVYFTYRIKAEDPITYQNIQAHDMSCKFMSSSPINSPNINLEMSYCINSAFVHIPRLQFKPV